MTAAPAGSWLPQPGELQKWHGLVVAEPPAPSTHPLGRRGTPKPLVPAPRWLRRAQQAQPAPRWGWLCVEHKQGSDPRRPAGRQHPEGCQRGAGSTGRAPARAVSAPSTGAPCAGQCGELPGHLQWVPVNYSLPGPETCMGTAGVGGISVRAEGPGAAPAVAQHQHTHPAHLAQVRGGDFGPVQQHRLDADPVPVQGLPWKSREGCAQTQPRAGTRWSFSPRTMLLRWGPRGPAPLPERRRGADEPAPGPGQEHGAAAPGRALGTQSRHRHGPAEQRRA